MIPESDPPPRRAAPGPPIHLPKDRVWSLFSSAGRTSFAVREPERAGKSCQSVVLASVGPRVNEVDPPDKAREKIINEICYHTSNKVSHLYGKFVENNRASYRDVLLGVCSELKINVDSSEVSAIEEKIVMKVLAETVERLNKQEREEIEKKLNDLNLPELTKIKNPLVSRGLPASLLTLKAGGFGTYIAASTALGALSKGLGFSLAFSTYTSMSSLIAYALGPVGIRVAALSFIAALSVPQPQKVIPAIVYIAKTRKELELERQEKKMNFKFSLILLILLIVLSGVTLIIFS